MNQALGATPILESGRYKLHVLTAFLAIGYVLTLDWSYRTQIAPIFSYAGYSYDTPPSWLFALSLVLVVLLTTQLPTSVSRPSHLVCWILYTLVIVPALIVPLYLPYIDRAALPQFGIFVAVAFALLCQFSKAKPLRLARIGLSRGIFWSFVWFVTIAAYGQMVLTGQLGFKFVGLGDVVDVRFEYRTLLGGAGGAILGYLVLWQAKVVNPVLVAVGLFRRRWTLLALGIVGQLLIFGLTGFRSVLLSGLLLAALYMLTSTRARSVFGVSFLAGLSALILLSSFMDRLFDTFLYTSVFVRRLIVTPGLLTGIYFQFFSTHPTTRLGHSLFAPFVDYPYDVDPAFIIGREYFGSPDVSANANFLADAFANFAWGGVLVFTVMTGLLLWITDSAARGVDLRLTALILALPAFSLTNSALLTVLLSHGFGLAILVILLERGASVVTSGGVTRDDRASAGSTLVGTHPP